MRDDRTFDARITAARWLAPRVLEVRLAHAELPDWEAGAHVDVHLQSGAVRQYSLCGAPGEDYRIAVLREDGGRGGSLELCRFATEGGSLTIGAPRNHFALKPAGHYVFVAGGIGVTPLLAMAREAAGAGVPWQFLYRGASLEAMAYRQELAVLAGGTVTILPADTSARPDFAALFAGLGDDALVYACGPVTMIDALREAATPAGCADRLVVELFGGVEAEAAREGDSAFEVELAQSGMTLTVPADKRLGEVLEAAGVPVTFSCEEGYCGTCETTVLEGVPDHRDSVLSDADRASGKYMMVCCSRAQTPRLVLDL